MQKLNGNGNHEAKFSYNDQNYDLVWDQNYNQRIVAYENVQVHPDADASMFAAANTNHGTKLAVYLVESNGEWVLKAKLFGVWDHNPGLGKPWLLIFLCLFLKMRTHHL